MIETASAGSGNVSDSSVHYLPALFVGVEILIEKMAEKAPALRDSDGINAMNRRGGLRIVFQVREEIANSGEAVKAFVVLRPGAALTAAELQDHCRAVLVKYKVPTQIEFVDALPRSGVGKINKLALKARG